MRGTSMRRYPSPLRYPGGKGKISNFMKLVVLENDLLGTEYVEPYAGGASVALSLLFEEFVSHIYINDINPGVFAFWTAVLGQPDELCKRILRTKPSVREWWRQREVQRGGIGDEVDEMDLAFSTFFLNRTNRSGIIDGGPIGGLDQSGAWKIDARYNSGSLVRRIRKVARFADRITVTGFDAKDFLKPWLDKERNSFIYLDPPYYVQGANLYINFYSPQDHRIIALLTRDLKSPWIVTYDAVPEVTALYEGIRPVEYSLSYSAADKYEGRELMFFSDTLSIPKRQKPTNISVVQVDKAKVAALGVARREKQLSPKR